MEQTIQTPTTPEVNGANGYTPTDEEIEQAMTQFPRLGRDYAVKSLTEHHQRSVERDSLENSLREVAIEEIADSLKHFELQAVQELHHIVAYAHSAGANVHALAINMLGSLNRMGIVSDQDREKLTN